MIGAVVAAIMWRSPNEFEEAVMSRGRQADVTDIVAKYIPSDFEGAVKALRALELRENDYYVGVTYRRQPIPERTEVNQGEISRMIYFNEQLDEYDADTLKRFTRVYNRGWFLFSLRSRLLVTLFITRSGETKMHAKVVAMLKG